MKSLKVESEGGFLGTYIGDNNLGALSSKCSGNCRTDIAGTACNQRHFSIQCRLLFLLSVFPRHRRPVTLINVFSKIYIADPRLFLFVANPVSNDFIVKYVLAMLTARDRHNATGSLRLRQCEAPCG